jgi:hypothetical protein
MTRSRIALALATMLAATAVFAASSPAATTTKLYAFLDGKAETKAGDPDGHARIGMTFDRAKGRICFDLRKFKLETPAGAHIHKGLKGKDGPVVAALITKPTGAGRGKITGCSGKVARTLIDAIIARPAGYYVNVHTATYPDGSVRGQLTTRKLV